MPKARRLVVFTDLDGTLLDHDSYSFDAASETLALMRQARVPLILCSSKTRTEIEHLRRQLDCSHPFVSENGAAVFIPMGYFPFAIAGARKRDSYEVLEHSRPYKEVVDVLHRTAAGLHAAVSGFSTMSVREVAKACSLSLSEAKRARCREYDEPFRLVGATAAARDRLCRALNRTGLRCVRGGRFDHVTGGADKGTGVEALQSLYRRAIGNVLTVGLGDSLNDLTMLRAVDLPVIVRNPAAGATTCLRRHFPAARVSRFRGPAGWAEMVDHILTEQGIFKRPVVPKRGARRSQGDRDRRSAAERTGDA
jgi:mannosyl-3-phosphoglycerate phosphatase